MPAHYRVLNWFAAIKKGKLLFIVPSSSCRLHVVCDGDILGPDVELPFLESNDAGHYVTRVHPYAHIDRHAMLKSGEWRATAIIY